MLDKHSFIYVYKEKVVQIAIDDEFKVLYKIKTEQQLYGYYGIFCIKGGDYLVIENDTGFNVIKVYYE
jgi:hypothetical protein